MVYNTKEKLLQYQRDYRAKNKEKLYLRDKEYRNKIKLTKIPIICECGSEIKRLDKHLVTKKHINYTKIQKKLTISFDV